MAKSKSGGTRTYLRGRVGADVYSIGKDAQGKKQQVVRSLAEAVANPQTLAQMRGRMVMSTVMQAQSALKPIIDHSFDNVAGVMPNLSEFISRNYGLVKADATANPSANNVFGLNQYKEKGVKQGAYVISAGQAVVPSILVLSAADGAVSIALTSDTLTIGGLKAALGMTSNDYFTIVGISKTAGAVYCRQRINNTLADTTAISTENIAQVFKQEGNKIASVSLDGQTIKVTLADAAGNAGVIVSRLVSGGYIHNDCTLSDPDEPEYTSDLALPTYPVGEQKFLNGGDVFGLEEQ